MNISNSSINYKTEKKTSIEIGEAPEYRSSVTSNLPYIATIFSSGIHKVVNRSYLLPVETIIFHKKRYVDISISISAPHIRILSPMNSMGSCYIHVTSTHYHIRNCILFHTILNPGSRYSSSHYMRILWSIISTFRTRSDIWRRHRLDSSDLFSLQKCQRIQIGMNDANGKSPGSYWSDEHEQTSH